MLIIFFPRDEPFAGDEDGAKGKSENEWKQRTCNGITRISLRTGQAFRDNRVLLIYLIVLMTGFGMCYHGSQYFYSTFLRD